MPCIWHERSSIWSKFDGPCVVLLNGFGASESGVDCRILSVITVNAAFVLVAMRPDIVVLGIRTARIFAEVITAG